MKFWQTTVVCAHCKKAQFVDQPGMQPVGWVVVACTESKFDPQQPQAMPQAVLVPYPFCGPVCAAMFALARAYGSLRTKEDKESFLRSLRGIKWLGEGMKDEEVLSALV